MPEVPRKVDNPFRVPRKVEVAGAGNRQSPPCAMSSRSERALIKARAAYATAADTYDHTRSEWSLASKAEYAADKAFDAAHTRENRAALRNAEKLAEALLILMTRQGKEMLTLEKIRDLKYRQHVDFLERQAQRDEAAARREAKRSEEASKV